MGITETFYNIAIMPLRQKNANQVSVELTNYMGVVLDTLTFMQLYCTKELLLPLS